LTTAITAISRGGSDAGELASGLWFMARIQHLLRCRGKPAAGSHDWSGPWI
jgi:hypothetical protein